MWLAAMAVRLGFIWFRSYTIISLNMSYYSIILNDGRFKPYHFALIFWCGTTTWTRIDNICELLPFLRVCVVITTGKQTHFSQA